MKGRGDLWVWVRGQLEKVMGRLWEGDGGPMILRGGVMDLLGVYFCTRLWWR